MTPRAHVIYLAVIAVLIIAVAYATAHAVRARSVLAEVGARLGLGATGSVALPRGGALRPAPVDPLRPRTFDEYRREVDALLARAQALDEFGAPSRLSAACGLALDGGKRLRAIILLEIARATSLHRAAGDATKATPVDAAEAALFIEYLHTASLIIDDLPAFDDDATRRGRPSVHAAAGPAIAQMAALSLVAAAFQNICRQLDWVRAHCPEARDVDRIGTRICAEVSRALGAAGAAGGQCMDIASAEALADHGPSAIAELLYRKTATVFEVAAVAGGLTAGGAPERVEMLRAVGRHVGTAFQIADDLGDMARDAARAAGGRGGWNYANAYGRAAAEEEVEWNLRVAQGALAYVGCWTPLWDEIYVQVRAMASV